MTHLQRTGKAAALGLMWFLWAGLVGCSNHGAEAPTVTITSPTAGTAFNRTFTWQPVSGATRYDVAVFASDGTRSFEVRDLTTPGVKLSDGVQLAPGRYSVQVTARRDRDVLAQSSRADFEITAGSLRSHP